MNRFSPKQTRFSMLVRLLLPLCSTLLVLFLFLCALSSVSETTGAEQKKSLEDALNRSIMQCYALEGAYPESLDYLLSHYAVTYDTDTFYVDYRPIAENILPDVTVISK